MFEVTGLQKDDHGFYDKLETIPVEGTSATLVIENRSTVSIHVEKKWEGGSTVDKPTVTIVLKRKIEFDKDYATVKRQEITAAGNWQVTFENLPKYDKKGNLYIYTVDEEFKSDLFKKGTAQAVEGKPNNYTITNTYVVPKPEIEVRKVWSGGPTTKPTVTIELLQNEKVYKTAKLENGCTSYKWTDLDKTDKYGNDYTYTVREQAVTGYTSVVNGTTITNTYVVLKAEIKVTKIWSGGPATKPTVTIELLRNGKVIKKAELATGTTSYSFKDLDKTDKDGNDYTYTVREQKVNGYTSVVNGTSITNTYVVPKTEIEVHKIWKGGPKEKPTIVIDLLRDGQVYYKTITLKNNETAYKWANLERTDGEGKVYIYTIKERPVAGYETKQDGTMITNTYLPPVPPVPPVPPTLQTPEPKLSSTGSQTSFVAELMGGMLLTIGLAMTIINRRKEEY